MSIRLSSLTALVLLAAGAVDSSAQAVRRATKPVFHPNRVKYSDVGAKPATGRAGSATLEARVTISKDGTSFVEASTGSLDDGTTRGSISKMQVKILPMKSGQPYVQNHAGNGSGLWSATIPGLGRNQQVQLQANIAGADANRTGVVTVTATAKRRPDLAVEAVTAPTRTLAKSRINVVATVSEKNGDVGARSTCVLTIDSRAVDQAAGIWVDAGQTVSCAFQTTIDAVGVHEVGVYVSGVSPLDWDSSNNAASTAVEILPSETPMNYSASFDAQDYTFMSHYKNTSADGAYHDEQTESGSRLNRAMSMSSWNGTASFAFPVRVRAALSSGGSSVFDVTKEVAVQEVDSWPGADCGSMYEGGFYVSVCNYAVGSDVRSQVDVTSYDGRVTYFGTRFYQTDGYDGYTVNESLDYSNGAGGYAVGTEVKPLVELSDARGMLFAARPTITLEATPIADKWGSCYTDARTTITYCSDGSVKGMNKSGQASRATP